MFKGLCFFVRYGWKSDKRYILYNVFYQLLNSLIPLVSIAMPKFIIDELMGMRRVEYLAFYVGIIVGYLVVAKILTTYFSQMGFTLRVKVSTDFDRFLNDKLSKADFINFDKPEFLDMKKRAEKFLYGDWHGFSYVLDSALMIIGQVITLAGIVAIIATLNIWILVLFIILIALSSIVEMRAKKNQIAIGLQAVEVERRWMYFSGLFTQFQYGKEIRVNRISDWLLLKLEEFHKQSVDFYHRRNLFLIKSESFGAITIFIQQCIAYWYVIGQVINNQLSIGDFTLYIGAITGFALAMKKVVSSVVDIKVYGAYYDALQEYLNIPQYMRENKQLPLPNGEYILEFKNVSFRYPGQETNALSNVNITIKSGQRLAVVGENGAGKTTFVKLLIRMYDPTDGKILLNDVDIKDIDYDSYMDLFSVVFQDYKLFSFSLKENVILGKDEEDEKVLDILTQVGLGKKVESLPKGIHNDVYKEFDKNGFEPSGGEGQRIALARALYKDAPIVVLDEPTAALDPRAENEIYKQFDVLVRNKTAVYISHRMASTRFCDSVIVFDKGRIVEYGNHDELLKQNGLYAEFYNMQSQYYKDGAI